MTKKIGRMIRDARNLKGLSQAELAAKIGVSAAAVGHWERGTFTPKGKNINALSSALDISLQGELPLPEFDEPEEKESNKGFARESFFNRVGHDGKVASDHRSRVADFDYSLACALSDFDNTVQIKSQSGAPKHDSWTVDLMNERTVIEVKHATSYHHIEELVERALWKISFLRAFFGEHLLYIAIIHRPSTLSSIRATSPAYERSITRLAAEADLVGIHLVLVDTAEEAAQAVRDLEEIKFNTE